MENIQNGGTLQHHGVLGQRWGVRRTENQLNRANTQIRKNSYPKSATPKGTITKQTSEKIEPKKRYTKQIIVGSVAVAAAAYYVHKNPEKIGKALSTLKNVKMKDVSEQVITAGKKCADEMVKGAIAGVKEGMAEAPKKAGKAVVTGTILYGTKKVLDSTVGKGQAAIIFQANDNKKIGKFWKVLDDDKEDTD